MTNAPRTSIKAPPISKARAALRLVIDVSFQAWWESFAQILTKQGTVIGGFLSPGERNPRKLRPNKLQERLDQAVQWCLANEVPIRIIALKPRQKGCSTYLTAILYWLIRKFSFQACIIGGKLKQVRSLWTMLRRYCKKDVHDWPNAGEIGASEGAFTNESTVVKETAKDAEAGRSGTIHCLLCTEVARWSEFGVANASGVLNGIENCVPYEKNTFEGLESTARGASGPFYERWSKHSLPFDEFKKRFEAGTLGEITFIQVFAGWHEFEEAWVDLTKEQSKLLLEDLTDHEKAMVRDFKIVPEQIAWYRRTLANTCQGDLEMMKREYPTTPEEAFSSSIPSRFDTDQLKILMGEALMAETAITSGIIENPSGDNKIMEFVPDEGDPRILLADRPVPGLKYLVIVDPATGESMTEGDDPDCHGIIAIRRGYVDPDRGWQRPKVVASNMPEDRRDVDVAADDAYRLARYYGNCPVVVEGNKDPGFIVLLKQWGANLYERESAAQDKRQKRTGKLGFITKPGKGSENNQTRRWIIENLARSIRELGKNYEGIEIPFRHIVQELTTFVRYPDGVPRAMEGCHDDYVLAVAIGHALEAASQTYKRPSAMPELPNDLKHHAKRSRRSGGRGGRNRSGYS